MNKIIDPFTVNLPHLDLHGETTWSSEVLINNFIRDNLILHNYQIVIIHGKSTGILREEFNIPAVGDIRRVLVALSETEHLVMELFNYSNIPYLRLVHLVLQDNYFLLLM